MDRLTRDCIRFLRLPPSFSLTSASICRPIFSRSLPLGSLCVWSASAVTPDVNSSFGCPGMEIKETISSWWTSLGRSVGSSAGTISPVRWEDVYPTDADSENHFDYIRLAQILISLAGIGLSLTLMYYLIEQINPTAKEKRLARKRAQQLFTHLGLGRMPQLTDYEVGIAVNLVDTRVLSTGWHSICGLDSVINELQDSVIEPFQRAHLLPFRSRLLRPPKGVLLFGPPGCGKTMLARAMARAANAYFINLQIAALVNMWYGETQKYVEATFTLAHKLQPSIIFIDELDSFLTTRSYTDNESTRMIKTQFMALWDGLLTEENTRILIVGATNRPGDLDQAILRRLPYKVSVPMPNAEQRFQVLSICLENEPLALGLTGNEIHEIASRTDGLSGSDLNELCREAAFCCYRSEKGRQDLGNMRLRREHFFTALQKFLSNRVASGIRAPDRLSKGDPIPLD
ncbi:unnamed protein product [Calicophoron daubneyi]|uniref:AAA+ ATPase domain-containing protein n=1 Tax=Calicophoron daubneyi TaxID=300641 RepID=A0AAV2TR35_CALDB